MYDFDSFILLATWSPGDNFQILDVTKKLAFYAITSTVLATKDGGFRPWGRTVFGGSSVVVVVIQWCSCVVMIVVVVFVVVLVGM